MGPDLDGEPSSDKPVEVWAKSMFGAKTRRGLVELKVAGARVVMEREDARKIARDLLEAAEAAEQRAAAGTS